MSGFHVGPKRVDERLERREILSFRCGALETRLASAVASSASVTREKLLTVTRSLKKGNAGNERPITLHR